MIKNTFLTDTHDLYIIVETKNQFNVIYHINLDSANPMLEGPILKYPFSDVDDKQISSFHVRGSSSKEKVNLNKGLICFMLHGENLYGWEA